MSLIKEKKVEKLSTYLVNADKTKLFVSYSRHDVRHKNTLIRHLAGMRNKIVTWHDSDILPGEDWNELIKTNLNEAKIVLYLVTAHSLATEFIQQVELPLVEERCRAGECILVPIIVSFCDWEASSFAKYDWLPKKEITHRSWTNSDEAWKEVIKGLKRVLEVQGQS